MSFAVLPVLIARWRCRFPRLWWLPVWRIRWLLVCVSVLTWFVSPVTVPAVMEDGASRVRILTDTVRVCLVLALLVIAVDAAGRAGSRRELLAGLLWWFHPVRYVGLSGERIAARLWLILRILPDYRREWNRIRDREPPHRRVAQFAAWLSRPPPALEEKYAGRQIRVDVDTPLWRDWLLPLFLLVFFLLTRLWE